MTKDLASQAAPTSYVLITRVTAGRLEVLADASGKAPHLPSALLAEDEHPCEAAWRAFSSAADGDPCQAFRKLKGKATPGGPTVHYFQASPASETSLSVGSTFAWHDAMALAPRLIPEAGEVLGSLL